MGLGSSGMTTTTNNYWYVAVATLDGTCGLCSAFVDDFGGVADDDDDDMGMGASTPFAFAAAGGLDTEGPAPGPQGLTLVAQPRKVDKVRACRICHLLPFTIACRRSTSTMLGKRNASTSSSSSPTCGRS
jgi:hypothetical protein